jgi:hypothetical protein
MIGILHYLYGILCSIIITSDQGLSTTRICRPNVVFINTADLGRGDMVKEVLTTFTSKQYIYRCLMISYWPQLKGLGFDPVGTIHDLINNSLAFTWSGKLKFHPALHMYWMKFLVG